MSADRYGVVRVALWGVVALGVFVLLAAVVAPPILVVLQAIGAHP